MSKAFELVYFDARARAEPTRLAFHAVGQKFDDKRLSFDAWKTEKPNAPQGRLPYLVIKENGKEEKLSQSRTILRYVGREFDLYAGGDKLAQARVDEVIDTCIDVMDAWEKAYFSGDEKEKKLEAFKKETVPKFYLMLEDLVKGNVKNGFAVGSKLSIADCMLFSTIEMCGEDCLDKYPSLKANQAKVKADKKIEAYLKSRKQTDI